jgi:hypothetical protein
MGKGKSTFAHVRNPPCESLTSTAQKLNGYVDLVAEISSVFALHPGKRLVEKPTQQPILNGLTQHEIGFRFNRLAYVGDGVNNRKYDRLLVSATGAYLGEQFRCSRDTTVNSEAIEVAARRVSTTLIHMIPEFTEV